MEFQEIGLMRGLDWSGSG